MMRALRMPLVLVALYGLLRLLFARLAADDGLLSPGGTPQLGVVGLGLLAVVLKLVVLFAVPPLLCHRLVLFLVGLWHRPPADVRERV
jgi:hypothetical protein